MILAYHQIDSGFGAGLSRTTPGQFEKQVRFLHENEYRTVSVVEYLKQGQFSESNVVITFDDAYESVYRNALPILSHYNMVATVFPITKFVGGHNVWDYGYGRLPHCSWKQLQHLTEVGWEVGSHTATHQNLRSLSTKRLWNEIRYSKEVIENRLGRSISVISYPFGSYNQDVMDLAAAAGYVAGCSLGAFNRGNQYALPRCGVYFFEAEAYFALRLKHRRLRLVDNCKQVGFAQLARLASSFRFGQSH